ncbi:MAG: hypothetical protein R2682_01605 [Pyrinomonadaceae bacterium]
MRHRPSGRASARLYDRVVLLDRITEPPSPEWLAEKRKYFLDLRVALGLPRIEQASYAAEFQLPDVCSAA